MSDKISVPITQKIEGTVERLAGHMLPGTDLGHELKAEGALKKGDITKAEVAASHLPAGTVSGATTYAEGMTERGVGHALPGTTLGHHLKAEGALKEGDYVKATKAAREEAKSNWGGPY
ncbi:hypothetical protein HDU93_001706 [Gonapodya sp. JEL0774]|nr:hypothetical protein HDU93_001706 [Gonapodya sp. JEL0774]